MNKKMKIYLSFCQNQGSSVCMAVLALMYLMSSVTMGSVVWGEDVCTMLLYSVESNSLLKVFVHL